MTKTILVVNTLSLTIYCTAFVQNASVYQSKVYKKYYNNLFLDLENTNTVYFTKMKRKNAENLNTFT